MTSARQVGRRLPRKSRSGDNLTAPIAARDKLQAGSFASDESPKGKLAKKSWIKGGIEMAGLGTGIALVGYGIGSELANAGIVSVPPG